MDDTREIKNTLDSPRGSLSRRAAVLKNSPLDFYASPESTIKTSLLVFPD